MRRARVISQWAFGLLFLVLFWQTRYLGEDLIPYPVNAFFRMDPLAGLASMAAARAFMSFFWPLLLLVPALLLFGRFFCGWICPLGSTLDLLGRKSRVPAPPPGGALYRVKDFLLVLLLASSLFSLNLAGLLDPLSFLIRTLAIGVIPPLEAAVRGVFTAAYGAGGPLREAGEPLFRLLSPLLSFRPPAFHLTLLLLLLAGGVLGAELAQRRYWCRNLCPLGALLGWLGARAPMGMGVDGGECNACGRCAQVCPMGACEKGKEGVPSIRRRDCSLCWKCVETCPTSCIGPARGRTPGPVLSLSRRQFLTGAAAGALLPLATLTLPRESVLPADLIRPPGSLPESRFLRRCMRCGECMRVCLTNGLQPTLLEAGLEALWTPRLVSRQGYCEYSCTLCGQVCPTDAIRSLDPVEKRKVRIGLAVITRDLCIPYVRPEQCMVCEEHCPTPRKAIVFDDVAVPGPAGPVTVKRPRVLPELCIGCGICETKCPLQGQAAIRVVRQGEDRAVPFS